MSMPDFSLEGQVAIVTGGGTGIGRSITLEFARAGADVVVASRRLSVLEKVGEEVRALGKRSLAVPTDISRKADVDNLVQRVMDEFGVIDILVNNASLTLGYDQPPYGAPLLELSEEGWDKVINTDLKGYYLCCQAVGKKMVEQKKGNIINISSVAGMRGSARNPAYSIAKAGVIMLTRGLARELASHNIRVNAIAPGLVRTDMDKRRLSDPELVKQAEARIPLGRIPEPSDIASVALFLASDASRHVTGDTILVDGGSLA